MYKCKINNDCNNDYLCCASCPDLKKCSDLGVTCGFLQSDRSIIKCKNVLITKDNFDLDSLADYLIENVNNNFKLQDKTLLINVLEKYFK